MISNISDIQGKSPRKMPPGELYNNREKGNFPVFAFHHASGCGWKQSAIKPSLSEIMKERRKEMYVPAGKGQNSSDPIWA